VYSIALLMFCAGQWAITDSVSQSPIVITETEVKPPELTVKPLDRKPFYIVMFTASWCGPCQAWKQQGGQQAIEAAGYEFVVVDIDAQPKWKSKVDRFPSFWICDRAKQSPQYKYIGSIPPETIVAKAEQLAKPPAEQSLFGFAGSAHESRETLIRHLMEDAAHKGRHSLSRLQSMTDEQLDTLHNSDHGGNR